MTKTPYHAVAKFLKAYYYYNLTSMMGDVPLSEAVKAWKELCNQSMIHKKMFFCRY